MLGIVLAKQFRHDVHLLGLVGVSSYLLIGFWYERPSAATRRRRRLSRIVWATSVFCSASF